MIELEGEDFKAKNDSNYVKRYLSDRLFKNTNRSTCTKLFLANFLVEILSCTSLYFFALIS